MSRFSNILKTSTFQPVATEVAEVAAFVKKQELKLAYNMNHDDKGRFSSHEGAASRSGAHDTSHANSYGVTGSRHKAMTHPKTSRGGKAETALHREAHDAGAQEDSAKGKVRGRDIAHGLYIHQGEGEGASKVAQAVLSSRTVTAGRDKTAREDYVKGDGPVSAEHARHLLTALKTNKNVTIFQSHALDKSSDQAHRQITQHIDKKAFKNIDALHDHLEKHGLGDAIVHKTEDGYQVIHRMSNGSHAGGKAAGRAKQRRVMEFRRSMKAEHVTTDHHSGTKKSYNAKSQVKELKRVAAANPDHAVSKAFLAHIGQQSNTTAS